MIIENHLLIFALLLFIIKMSLAQFPANTVYRTIPAGNPPALPALFASVIDSTVPDPIALTRITEFNAVWNWYPVHDYAKIQPWNADASLYKFSSVALYDAHTHRLIRELPGGEIYPSYWSNTNPDLIFSFRENGDIRTYSVKQDTFKTIFQLQGYQVVKLGPGEGNIDKNDHFVALIGKNALDLTIIVFDLQTSRIVQTRTFAGAWGKGWDTPYYIDWVSVSQSGKYVGILWNHNTTSANVPFDGHYGVEIYNASDLHFLRRIAAYGNHGDFGFTPEGEEVFVQFWGETGTVNAYYLDRMEHFVVQDHADFGGEGHISCRNLNRPGWAYVSIDAGKYGVMLALKLDLSQTVEYFGHHYSSSNNYITSPMPVPAPNGDKLMFKSDFGQATNNREVFCFEAQKANALTTVPAPPVDLNLFPNPAHESLHIEHNTPITSLKLFNILGQQIRTITHLHSTSIQLDLNGLSPGIYFIQITNNCKHSTSKKFVKIGRNVP